MSEENPYLAPQGKPGGGSEQYLNDDEHAQSPVEEPADVEREEPESYEYAGFFKRAIAKSIDMILFGLAFMFLFGLFVGIKTILVTETSKSEQAYHESVQTPGDDLLPSEYEDWEQVEDEAPWLSDYQAKLILFACFMVTAALSEWISGQSIGKLLFGLQVVRVGRPALPSLGSALGRNVGLIFDGLFFGIFAFFVMRSNPRKQRAGDIAAGTLVVLRRSVPDPPLNTAFSTIHGLVAGSLCIFFIALALSLIFPVS